MTLTAEPGIIGGVPAGGFNFGAATNAQAVIDMAYQFDFYDGGGLDAAFLGLAQADKEGNLNVSKFGPRLAGAGGFINISQNAKKVVFCGTLTAGDLEISVVEGKLLIERDGKEKKFVDQVEHRTFSGPYAAQNDKDVLYVTERCVFRLTKAGVELIEVAPGIDIKRDILDRMDFEPVVRHPRVMDPRIFRSEPMGLREEILRLPFEVRFNYDDEHNILFLNLSELQVKTQAIIERYKEMIRSIVEPLGHKVYAVVNYDGGHRRSLFSRRDAFCDKRFHARQAWRCAGEAGGCATHFRIGAGGKGLCARDDPANLTACPWRTCQDRPRQAAA